MPTATPYKMNSHILKGYFNSIVGLIDFKKYYGDISDTLKGLNNNQREVANHNQAYNTH